MAVKVALTLSGIRQGNEEYPREVARLQAAGMPAEAQFVRYDWPGKLLKPAYAAYRFEMFGIRIDPAAIAGAPYFILEPGTGPEPLCVQVWLQRVTVDGCASYGEIAWTPQDGQSATICNVNKARGVDELARIYRALRVAAQVTKPGRPPGTGQFANEAEFRAALRQALDRAAAYGERVTQESIAELMVLETRQFQRLLSTYGPPWADVRRGSF